jgi:hypothetical protein
MKHKSMVNIGTAFLTSSIVASSPKVQPTRFAIDLWDEIRSEIELKTRLDYLTALLCRGRLMDLKINEKNYTDSIRASFENIRNELAIAITGPIIGEREDSLVLAENYIVRLNDIASAMITSSFTDLSDKVESTKEIIEFWADVRKRLVIHDNKEFLVSLLVTSRIGDFKKTVKPASGLDILIENFQGLLPELESDIMVTKIDLAAAYLTIGVITQTPEIESNSQILQVWKKIRQELKLRDVDIDIVAAILTGGLLRNMTMKMDFHHVKDTFTRVKNRLLEMKIE